MIWQRLKRLWQLSSPSPIQLPDLKINTSVASMPWKIRLADPTKSAVFIPRQRRDPVKEITEQTDEN